MYGWCPLPRDHTLQADSHCVSIYNKLIILQDIAKTAAQRVKDCRAKLHAKKPLIITMKKKIID